ENVPITRNIFHTLSIPRFSWIITLCKNAVPISQGKKAAFSTGSQPQYPPQPRTSYAQRPPSSSPKLRNIQAINAQRRVSLIQLVERSPDASAAIANANGITMPTKPIYSIGG